MSIFVVSLFLFSIISTVYGVSLSDDPSMFPGHLEPLGSKRPQQQLITLEDYPEPIDFFQNYVDKSIPFLVKRAAKKSAAYKLWQDDYLKSHNESDTFQVFVEDRKKENRSLGGRHISLREFINTYHKTDMYMVNGVPDHLQKDLRIPSPLRCEDTRPMLVDTVTWFSSGGTKSVLHNDDVDNINCLIRGKKQLLFINYEKYKTKVTIDRPEGGYSAMDVDALDFVKYPGMREVEYINGTMEEGDCLFIPYKWFHQVNSWSNDDGMNLAVNVWFKHLFNHQPKECKLAPADATLDKYKFSDLEQQKNAGKSNEKGPSFFELLEGYIQKSPNGLVFEDFVEQLKKDRIITKVDIAKLPTLQSLKDIAKPLFDFLDETNNGKLEVDDFDLHEKLNSESREGELKRKVASIEDYAEDLFESITKGTSTEDFEAGLKSTPSDNKFDEAIKDEL